MINSDQLNKTDALPARDLTGKVRLISFSVEKTAAADTVFLVAKLPAGRGRLLPALCAVSSSSGGGAWSIGNLAFRSADMTVGTVAAVPNIITSATTAANTLAAFGGAVAASGWAYESIEDVGITLTTTANVAAGSSLVGYLAYTKE